MFNRGVNGGTSSPALGNVTFSANSASFGGALANDGFNGNSQTALVNVILWGDTAASSGRSGNLQCRCHTRSSTTAWCRVPAAAAAGTSRWAPITATTSTPIPCSARWAPRRRHATLLLGASSAAIDTGTCTGVSTDQRGVSRPQGGNCDIGAVEVRQAQLSVTVGANGSVIASASAALIGAGIGTCNNATCTASYDSESAPVITVSATPAAHYHFVWSGDCADNGDGTASVTMDADRACNASFALDNYTLTYTAGANGSISGTSPQSVQYGADGTTVTAVPAAHYHFVQWSDGLTTPSRTDTNVSAAINVAASFAIDSYTVRGAVGTGSGSITPGNQSVDYGQSATFTVSPDAHFHLVGFGSTCTGTPNGNTYTTGAITADCTVTANFAIDSFTISGAVSGGHGSISPTSFAGAYGATPSFTLIPDAYYHVASVSGCGGTLNGNSYTIAPIAGPCTVSATFVQTIAPYTPVPALDWRMLLLLAGLLSLSAVWRLRHG